MLLLHIFQIWRTAENAADHTPINPSICATAQPQKERREKFRRNMGLWGCGSGKGHPANQEHPWGSPKLIPYFNAEGHLAIFLNHQIIPSNKSLRMGRKFTQDKNNLTGPSLVILKQGILEMGCSLANNLLCFVDSKDTGSLIGQVLSPLFNQKTSECYPMLF
ncbi:hypothetical protein Ddc_06406 [Ditylenchus destructor]|nr:hypothetical protein Ddc_06406 [Ditylenchus destructor]